MIIKTRPKQIEIPNIDYLYKNGEVTKDMYLKLGGKEAAPA